MKAFGFVIMALALSQPAFAFGRKQAPAPAPSPSQSAALHLPIVITQCRVASGYERARSQLLQDESRLLQHCENTLAMDDSTTPGNEVQTCQSKFDDAMTEIGNDEAEAAALLATLGLDHATLTVGEDSALCHPDSGLPDPCDYIQFRSPNTSFDLKNYEHGVSGWDPSIQYSCDTNPIENEVMYGDDAFDPMSWYSDRCWDTSDAAANADVWDPSFDHEDDAPRIDAWTIAYQDGTSQERLVLTRFGVDEDMAGTFDCDFSWSQ